jgi:hypothetical protein
MSQFNNAARFRSGEPCPWGQVQLTQIIAPGITHVITAGHGGYLVTRDRYAEMSQHLRECSYTKDQWFEEDCSWCAVVLTWPQYFSLGMVAAARDTYARVYKQEHDIPDFMREHAVELD